MINTLLVTGGAGFIGSCFVAQQIACGKRVVVLDALTYAGHRENLDGINSEKLIFVKGDIRDGALVARLLKEHNITGVVDFAAESHVDNSIARPAAFIETNVLGCYTLLESSRSWYNGLNNAAQEHFRFVHVSTDEVYGSLGETGKFTEESPMRPNSPYSASKAAGDHLCRAWFHTYGLPVIVTNCTNNYGARQFPEKFIPRIITTALAGEKIPIYGDGKNIRDWIHVEDHCTGVALALEKGRAGETYAFGGDAERNNIQVAETICKILDEMQPRSDGQSYKKQMSFVPDRAGHDRRYAIDDSKAQRELGFSRRYQFEDGLRDTVSWYLENNNWRTAVTKNYKVG
jgi:dTDP-glucose 4,6-dehydratase